jgi:hypothetical protein
MIFRATLGYGGNISGNGIVTGDVSGAADKTITANGGPLALGSLGSTAGFNFDGMTQQGPTSRGISKNLE